MTSTGPDTQEVFIDNQSSSAGSRAILGFLVILIAVAVALALWFVLFGDNDSVADRTTSTTQTASATPEGTPTPLAIPTGTANSAPLAQTQTQPEAIASEPEPTTQATPLPDGLEPCSAGTSPDPTRTYKVDTDSAALKHRAGPSADADQLGSSPSATFGLRPTGECAVNLVDGFTWWKIAGSAEDFWVASDFVSPG